MGYIVPCKWKCGFCLTDIVIVAVIIFLLKIAKELPLKKQKECSIGSTFVPLISLWIVSEIKVDDNT